MGQSLLTSHRAVGGCPGVMRGGPTEGEGGVKKRPQFTRRCPLDCVECTAVDPAESTE